MSSFSCLGKTENTYSASLINGPPFLPAECPPRRIRRAAPGHWVVGRIIWVAVGEEVGGDLGDKKHGPELGSAPLLKVTHF